MAGKYEHSNSELTFKVTSIRTVEDSKKYVAYTITVQKKGSASNDRPSIIERRYTEFLELYTNLRNEFPHIFCSFNFPKKVVIGNFSTDIIESRSASFESLLLLIASYEKVKESPSVIHFLQKKEQTEALSLNQDYSERLQGVVLLENSFRLLNKLLTDRHGQVLRSLCLLVACCELAADPRTPHFTHMAVQRFEGVSDTDSLKYYVPLLQLAIRQIQSAESRQLLEERLSYMKRRGMRVDGSPSLLEAVLSDLHLNQPVPTEQ